MRLRHFFTLVFVTLALTSGVASADLRVASFNIQNLGWGEVKRYDHLADIVSRFDLVAVQEVMNAEAIYRLRDELESTSGESWGVLYSDRLGRTRYREKYAFLWRDSSVEFTGEAVTYIDDADLFAREPMAARFRSMKTGLTLVYATLHAVYGNTVAERVAEAVALRQYWDWLAEVFAEGEPIIIGGDFNLPPSNNAWDAMRDVAFAAITDGATTVSPIDGRFANLYDNFWLPLRPALAVIDAGIMDVPAMLGLTHGEMRRFVSDHVPVYFRLHGAPPVSLAAIGNKTEPEQDTDVPFVDDPDCVDLNQANVEELQQIQHIAAERARDIVAGRPWDSVDALARIDGIGPARLRDIHAQGVACVP
ncbi:MAG: endonuclease/exonuclease/phosphatase family protein [Aquisalimonadaceae bacterium]